MRKKSSLNKRLIIIEVRIEDVKIKIQASLATYTCLLLDIQMPWRHANILKYNPIFEKRGI
jgi:hypothetical protein